MFFKLVRTIVLKKTYNINNESKYMSHRQYLTNYNK